MIDTINPDFTSANDSQANFQAYDPFNQKDNFQQCSQLDSVTQNDLARLADYSSQYRFNKFQGLNV
jgi:hypothetical protein